ncbi:hypothetical protein IC575_022478 [Cucumis melo]|uniref:Receptor-like protein EIX2 n=1 Tax=Cucumis melo TaxID=3656 RepID=A0A1S4E676_CUCME|nr:receptor-like protein EIX2 [Cucumis melo]
MRKLSEKSSVVLVCVLCMMLLLLPFCLSVTAACVQKECEALLQFKNSFYDDPSHRLASWNGTDCCNWNGVGCHQITGHVTIIDLRYDYQVDSSPSYSNNSIDSSLLELKYLNYLDLSGNNFYTQIPSFLGSMVELTYLNLSDTAVSGKVPPHLGNLTKLDTLDLSFNYELQMANTGDVEWISHLSSLQFLGLAYIDFSKSLNLMQVISSLPMLSSLRLRACRLQSTHFSLSSWLNYSSFLSRIQLLDLSFNLLNDTIPKAFQNMTSLKYLDLSMNQFNVIFEGGISTFIRNNCGLKVLDLSWNYNLGGDVFGSRYGNQSTGCDLQVLNLGYTSFKTKIPDWLGMLKSMKSLDLGHSKIYGPIPASLGNLSSLEYLDLGHSKIYGPIPASLGNLSSLEYLDLSRNALTGTIPTAFGRLLNLRKLYVQENRLMEVGNECFTQLEKLEELDISRNLLKGILTEVHFANLYQLHSLRIGYNELLCLDIKSDWNPPFQLQVFDASSCIGCFGGDFPQWLRTQKALFRLSLSNTSLSISYLPTWFTSHNLTNLDLSFNQIMGPLPASIGNQMPNLEELYLNNNLFDDSLPPSLCRLKSLVILDLSYNKLSGVFQDCLLTPNLRILDLSHNNFSGTFAHSHGNYLSNIEKLCLRNNNFEGFMPIVLKNSKVLYILDFEKNKFSGNIPRWIGNNLESLEILMLRSNLFNGTIPSSLCNLTYLKILDLANNQLEGIIPSKLSNFHEMTRSKYIYGESFGSLYYYCMNGRYFVYNGAKCPDGGKSVVHFFKSSYFNYSLLDLMSMVSIDLSNNSLVGFIPSEITKLKNLIGLNLSHNNLIGIVPTEIGEIESLESLDLSFNQLSGPIPLSLSKLNSLGMLKLSHNNFSGEIPREGHLSTFNEASSFDENPNLCGDPLPMKCVKENSSESPSKSIDNYLDQDQEDKWEGWLLYIMIILGYIVGFWGVVGSLIWKKSWRYGYYKFVDEATYKVHLTIWRSIQLLKAICTPQ